jgi:hypothetical protein
MQRSLGMSNATWRKFEAFIKQYIGMEEWFHDTHDKDEVRGARLEIAKVLRLLQAFFPRPGNTNGYNIPKMHGITKFVDYMILYGSTMHFYGGPGEANNKIFVKAAGLKTQRRVCEFAQQTVHQYYHMILTNYAMQLCAIETSNTKQRGALEKNTYEIVPETAHIIIELSGRYEFKVCEEVLKNTEELNEIDVEWILDRKREK